MAHVFRKLRLLIWKNLILQIRRPIGTVFEILLPVAFLALLIFAREMIDREEQCFTTYGPFYANSKSLIQEYTTALNQSKLFEDRVFIQKSGKKFKLSYYPNNSDIAEVMNSVGSILNLDVRARGTNGQAFKSVSDIATETSENFDTYMAAVIFNNYDTNEMFPNKVDYSIRMLHTVGEMYLDDRGTDSWATERIYPFFIGVDPRTSSRYKSPFLAIQYAVDSAILQKHTNRTNITTVAETRQYPYPNYLKDNFITIVQSVMALVFVLAFLYTAISIIKELVAEKQARIKESMKMMGLANWVHWTAWFIKNMLFLLITIILSTILMKAGKIFEFSDGGVIFVFMLLYMLASLFSLFFVSTLFSHPIRAMLFGATLWVASLAPYLSYSSDENYEAQGKSVKAASCLLPNSCLGIMVRIISQRETARIGVDWNNFNKGTDVKGENFTLGQAFGILLIDCLLYGVLTWYVENVFPGDYGIPRPFYFPLQPSYWCGTRTGNRTSSAEDLKIHNKRIGDDYEEEPEGMKIGVEIENLRKVFKGPSSSKVAVDDLTLNIYKGQITALLGHNGAGKTTTMSILTGLFPASGGRARVNGKNAETEMDAIRESLGLCPQHNVLFDRLTVKEHLEFFSALKGVPKAQAKVEVQQMLEDIQLLDKAKDASSTLSGGMKRKLCCAIALIGGSETVFLDEPTSGMDPYARRATWDLLQKYRTNKTIILTTHFMDEADYLGDRIAIMAEGKLRCCGSSLFLKKKFGVGYHMTIVKGDNFNENRTISLMNEMVPTAKISSNVGAEMSYVLEEESSKQFKPLFEIMEGSSHEYGISSFGISVTTLEEVFLKVGEGGSPEMDLHENENSNGDSQHAPLERRESRLEKRDMLTGCNLALSQFNAMFIKRFLNSLREKKAIITQILIPVVLVLIGCLLSISSNPQQEDPKLALQLSMLKEKSEALYGYHVDYRNTTQAEKDIFVKMSRNYYDGVSVTFQDKTAQINDIKANNSDNKVNILFAKSKYKAKVSSSFKECCNYKFVVLNKDCRNQLSPVGAIQRICDTDLENFAYKACLGCSPVSSQGSSKSSSCGKKDQFGGTPTVKGLYQDPLGYPEFQEYILEESTNDDLSSYYKDRAVALTLDYENGTKKKKPVLWYSSQGLHTLASALSAGSNILLKVAMNSTNYQITTNNFPLPRNTIEKTNRASRNPNTLVMVIFIAMAVCFVAASFVTFIVNEKTSKAKHIQFVSGVNSLCYWGATLCWDFINYLVPALLMFIVIAAFGIDELESDLGAVFLVLLMYGVAILPFVYLLSFIFTSSVIAYAVIALVLMLLSMAMVIAVFIVRLLNEKELFDNMHYVFLLFPTYALPQAISDISTNYNHRKICTASPKAQLGCKNKGTKFVDNVVSWAWPGIGHHCVYMLLEGIIYFMLVILIEEGFFIRRCFGKVKNTQFNPKKGEDVDVQSERQKVSNMPENETRKNAVVVKNLTKVYRRTGMTAVDHLSVAIPKSECFGLLGVNGAGKTTTFGMLTGELGITAGTAYLNGYNIQTQLKEVQQRIGYCPQFDALIENLTGREMLQMFARLRGIPRNMIEEVVRNVIQQLNLAKWADKLCGTYSGGNKRKLSTAMALVGDPPIIFLDEPTSGMDPASRRFLWNTLSSILVGGRSIVLTSHSMEECEALCTRLVIMVNGQFKCIGSIQHLKSRFGQGYTIMMKISSKMQSSQMNAVTNPSYTSGETKHGSFRRRSSKKRLHTPVDTSLTTSQSAENLAAATNNVKEFMNKNFEGAHLVEERQGLLQYQIINPQIRWSQLFGTLEEHAERLGIVDYSVSQTSLEQVFINFAKLQHSEDRIINTSCCSCVCF